MSSLPPAVTVDGLVEYYAARGLKRGELRRLLKIKSSAFAALERRNNLRRRVDPKAHAELVKAVEDHFAQPLPPPPVE